MKTDDNLSEAFAGESMARNKYEFFAKVAKKEGFHYIARLFEETADNEKQHAKEHFKLMKGIGSTAENLKEAMDGEHYENTEMYPNFAKIAKEEGRTAEMSKFLLVSKVEEEHEARYKKLLEMVESGTVFQRDKEIKWKCSKCGHIHTGKQPPGECPVCKHALEYFEPEDMCNIE